MEISAVFPAYSEEGNIKRTVRSALDVLSQCCERFEVIIIDAGSTDRTAEAVQGIADQDPRVRLLRHGQNGGYGAALKTGFAVARHQWVFLSDADGQFDLNDIRRLLPYVNSADLIVGYRVWRQGSVSSPSGGEAVELSCPCMVGSMRTRRRLRLQADSSQRPGRHAPQDRWGVCQHGAPVQSGQTRSPDR